jgi:hypothetical protein
MHREASWLPVDQHVRMFDAHTIRASCYQPLQTRSCAGISITILSPAHS